MESYAQQTVRVLPDSVSFVAALLVEFPEFTGAAFDPRTGTVRLTLLVGRRLPARGRVKFARRLEDSIAVLHELHGGLPPRVEVRWQTGPNFTRFELIRSVEDLTVEEVRVVAQVAREAFGPDLLAGEASFEEGREEELRYALEHARHLRPSRPVVGLREGGRVLVYYVRRPRERMP
ncbi:MAG: hypothetical protein RMM30_06350 [Armatimonadota bacterium]|nr:hypothetical protein [Armatimonadota bacterium]MDW8156191.1 hypothetical protein [Armatimonadota bacterium]